ncbi:hypothetical protein D3C81_1257610 [compost metagenome]
MALVGGVEVDRDDQVAMARHYRHDRQRVENAAIDQHAVALHHRREQAGDCRRSAHGLVQAALLKPDFLLVGKVGGHCGVRDTQLLDIDFADDLADLAEYLVTTDCTEAKADVHQAQHIQVVEAFDPVAILLKLASSVDAANHRPHGAAGDAGDVVTAPLYFFDHTDVRIPSCTTRSQYQRHSFAHDFPSACATMV